MKRLSFRRGRGLRHLIYLLAAGGTGVCLLNTGSTQAAQAPSWGNPGAMALRRVSDVPAGQHEPTFLNNLDCLSMPYYARRDGSPHTGCFTRTALGLLDSDTSTVLPAGGNRGLPLVPYSGGEVLAPWANSFALIALDAVSTGGSYISLYESPLSIFRDVQDTSGQLVSKQLAAPPDLILKDASGKPLVINPQTMAFSDDGSWMAMETLNGAFVRVNLATLDVIAFAPAFGSQGSPGLLKSQVAISSNGHYVAIANKEAGSLRVYDLTDCGVDPGGLQPRNCAVHDYQTFVTGQIAGFQAVRHLRFVNDGLLSFEAQTGQLAADGLYELAPAPSIDSLIDYLALGDSYTSGEGALDYLPGSDTADDKCHASAHAYPLLLAQDLFSVAGAHSVACSGAEINDVGSTSPAYRGQVKGVGNLEQLQQSQASFLDAIMAGYLPGYVAQQRFVRQYQPGITTVSVGGNDIGFGDILQNCVIPHVSLNPAGNSCYGTYEDRLEITNLIDRIVPRWTELYKQLLSEAPDTRLYIVGYPQIVYDAGNCALNVHLDKSELLFSEELVDYLNAALEQAAETAGARYVDVSQALAGHRLCEAASYDVAVNGLTAGSEGGPFGVNIFSKGSYHPNALGQALLEQTILKQTGNFASFTLGAVGSTARNILNAPKTNRPVNTLVPDDGLTSAVASAGQSLSVQANGVRDSLVPRMTYAVRLDGAGGPIAGNATSDEQGNISAVILLPNNTPPGEHTIDLTGTDQAGDPVDVTRPVYVPVSAGDADGDGIPDSYDACPGAVNGGHDDDQDGIDDVCDASISLPPSHGGQTGTGAGSTPASAGASSGNSPPPTGSIPLSSGYGDSQGMAAVSLQATADQGPANRLLGASTVNPHKVNLKSFGPSVRRVGGQPRPFSGLYVINWLAVVAILWIPVLLGTCAIYFTSTPKRKARAPVF